VGYATTNATPNAGKDPTYNNGLLMGSVCQWNVLVNAMNEAPWGGAISQFETDLSRSDMIQIMDQYLAVLGKRIVAPYCGTSFVNYTFPDSVIIVDKPEFQAILNLAAGSRGSNYWGLGNLYHIFFTSAVKCIEDTYTNDQICGNGRGPFFGSGVYPNDWCGQHTYATNFTPGFLYYTIQPYQDYSLCRWCSVPSGAQVPLAHATAHGKSSKNIPARFTTAPIKDSALWPSVGMPTVG
jgi:hypothetical protein